MKKFLLALLAIVFAIPFANAGDLYLRGANYGNWAADSAYKFTEKKVNNNSVWYLYLEDGLSGKFKIGGTSSTWNDGNYGAGGAVNPGSNKFYQDGDNAEAVSTISGKLVLIFYATDEKEESNKHTIYNLEILDQSALEIAYLRGGSFNWDDNDCTSANQFSFDRENLCYTLTLPELKGGDYKIGAKSWAKNCNFGKATITGTTGSASLTYSSAENITVESNLKNVTLTFDWIYNSTKAATLAWSGEAGPYDKVYLYGDFNGHKDWDDQTEANRLVLTRDEKDNSLFSTTAVITGGDAYFRFNGVCGTITTNFYTTSSSDVTVESGKSYTFNNSKNSVAYKVTPGTYLITVSLEPGAKTGTITFKKAATALYIYGQVLNDKNVLCDSFDNKIALKPATDETENGTGETIVGSFEGTFRFAKSAPNSAMRRDNGDEYCSFNLVDENNKVYGTNSTDPIDLLSGSTKWEEYTPAALSSGDGVKAFLIEGGDHKIVINTLTDAVYAAGTDVATGVADVEVSEDALVNVYNYSGVMIRKGVKASEATLDLPKGLYIVGNKKMIVK